MSTVSRTDRKLALKVLNTMGMRKETFTIPEGDPVRMFVCGPTVYDYSHLGHARTYIAFDIMARYLRFKGHKLRYVMNITDVADRIIQRAEELKRKPMELAKEYENYFYEDLKALRIESVDMFARASDHIPDIIEQVKGLMERGFAYETETGIYFDVRKFKEYGALSHQAPHEIKLKRLELCSKKRNPEDFSLWRKDEGRGPVWDSPWGKGMPGWHVEDTAIAMKLLGPTYEIHGGASELVFPHHDAEIAQAEALTGRRPYVRYWLHTGLLNMSGRKMSKSLGNVITIRDALKRYEPTLLRFFFASIHYRRTFNFSESSVCDARRKLRRMRACLHSFAQKSFRGGASHDEKLLRDLLWRAEGQFMEAMDDDFDTPKAIRVLANLGERLRGFAKSNSKISSESRDEALARFRKLADIFGVF